MGISLFKHNEAAYEAVCQMLDRTGKAAVIHPTGTGKSFIGFKYCEDNAGLRICWLSPSAYIFNTQLENLKKAGGVLPRNVVFITYAKLMKMTNAEVIELRPDAIILDEFHRCGAAMWGQGVQRLLCAHEGAKLIGLSATNIRYLDNYRDMAKELFDGCVASELTLGDCIALGILNPPKYVLSVFKAQSDLAKYERRVANAKSREVRKKGECYLEALRRALEKADGLDVVFWKHMPDANGRYLVFCSDYEHVSEMKKMVPQWFGKIDANPHVYEAYSGDDDTEEDFMRFKEDGSDHLKLLFCIDMFNEGIHVENLSGVILLRPTVSPIVYKQQIGRALCAGAKENAVIFDVVMNIENLYSIDAVEEEVEIATAYYRDIGKEDELVSEHFKVVDELQDVRELFERLNETLSASWDLMYEQAVIYYEENGNLEVPSRYFTEDGYALGRWIHVQRCVRRGTAEGVLSAKQIEKLDKIGMIWGNATDVSWDKNYAAAKTYFEEFGNLEVPSRYVSKDGIALGAWLANIRMWERAGIQNKYLTKERKALLEKIGMVWDVLDCIWEKNYAAACAFYLENRHLNVPSRYVTNDGIRLGVWIAQQRALRSGKRRHGNPPSDIRIRRLDDIGMIWKSGVDTKWERAFEAAREYKESHGNLKVPNAYRTRDGLLLRTWIVNQRKRFEKGTLEKERVERLEEAGFELRKAE